MNKPSVIFGDPKLGWINVSLQFANQTFSMEDSDIYNPFFPLVDALLQLHTAPGQSVVNWTVEPTEYDMHFSRVDETVTLDILAWPDSSRNDFHQENVFSASGSYDEICLPFWRALRGLQGRFSAADLEERWEDLFPQRELNALTVALGKAACPLESVAGVGEENEVKSNKTMDCEEPEMPLGGWPKGNEDVCVCGHHADYHPSEYASRKETSPCSHVSCPCIDFKSQVRTS